MCNNDISNSSTSAPLPENARKLWQNARDDRRVLQFQGNPLRWGFLTENNSSGPVRILRIHWNKNQFLIKKCVKNHYSKDYFAVCIYLCIHLYVCRCIKQLTTGIQAAQNNFTLNLVNYGVVCIVYFKKTHHNKA